MANALFTSYKNNMLGTGTKVDLDADTIKIMFIDHGTDTPVPATDDFIDDILSGARVPAIASAPTLSNKTISGGAFDNTVDPVFTALTGNSVESIIVFKDTGTEATSDLLAFYDTGVTGLPFTPNGGNVTLVLHASGLWSL